MEQPKNEPSRLHGNLDLLAKSVVEGFITGLHKSPFHGFSVEFAEHRSYNSGDNVKNIDWKLFGKTDKLYTKRYEEETNLRCQFVIDTSSSMFYPRGAYNKLEFSVQATASLIHLLRKQRDAFGLSLFNENVWLNTGAKSTISHQQYVLGELEKVIDNPELNMATNLEKALHQVAESIHKRSLVVIFSDLLNTFHNHQEQLSLFSGLQHLKFNKHEVIIFSVSDKASEVDFQFENRPYQFIDIETGQNIKATATTVRENYLNDYQTYRREIALKCAQYKLDLIEADINEGFNEVLTAYLIKRRKMN